MATHSSILAWKIPWTEKPGGISSMGSQESDMIELTYTHTHTHTQRPYNKKKFRILENLQQCMDICWCLCEQCYGWKLISLLAGQYK